MSNIRDGVPNSRWLFLYYRATANDTMLDAPEGVDDFYARHLETCQRLCVEPVSPERVHELSDEWSEAIREATPTQY